jgi:hypothetical protein
MHKHIFNMCVNILQRSALKTVEAVHYIKQTLSTEEGFEYGFNSNSHDFCKKWIIIIKCHMHIFNNTYFPLARPPAISSYYNQDLHTKVTLSKMYGA